MGEATDQIKRHIEEKRDELGAHLNELEYRVKSAADWRAQVLKQPKKAMGIAFGGGMLLALMMSSRSSPTR
jgi:ElaB/YqjD/DUF883 family membrane-anchored ribosome-binding protein